MTDKCGACQANIHKNSYAILCFLCDNWYHIKCVEITVSSLNHFERELKKDNGERWNCPNCVKENVKRAHNSRKSLSSSQDAIDKKYTLEDVMNKLNSMETQHQSLIDRYEKQLAINDNLQKEIDDIKLKLSELVRNPECNIPNRSGDNTSIAEGSGIIREIQDRETRKKNVIIFGNAETNSQEEAFNEKKSTLDILQSINPSISEENIVHLYRLGRKQNNKPRPLKVILKSSEIARDIISKAKKLKWNPNTTGISVSFDRTPLQTKEYKDLKEQLNIRLASGEQNLRIRYINGTPKIVKVPLN